MPKTVANFEALCKSLGEKCGTGRFLGLLQVYGTLNGESDGKIWKVPVAENWHF